MAFSLRQLDHHQVTVQPQVMLLQANLETQQVQLHQAMLTKQELDQPLIHIQLQMLAHQLKEIIQRPRV